jgi:allantoin racemase
MRILVINPFGGSESNANSNFDLIKRPETEYDIVNIAEQYPLRNNQWLYFKYVCTDATLERVMEAERQGYDAVFLSCQLDIGLYEARTLVDIPVTGTLESAALLCYTMGKHFTLLSVDYQNGEIQRSLLKLYGLDTNLKSIIPIGIDADDLYPGTTPEDQILDRVVAATKVARDEHRAEMIIPGCTMFGALLTHHRNHVADDLGVPVVDGMAAGFKLAEMRGDLNRAGVLPAVSRAGYFTKPPRKHWETLRKFQNRPE